MAPTRPRQPNMSIESLDTSAFPAPPQDRIDRSPTKTPTRSPIKKVRRGITLKQKQALIDNLQLEIAERARKLRAQEALQCRGLRTRVEIRINRVPSAMRKPKMKDLLAKYLAQQEAKSNPILPGMVPKVAPAASTMRHAASAPSLAQKRKSDESFSDEENDEVSNPKKRSKPSPDPVPGPSAAARTKEPVKALSPRPANTSSRPTTATSTNSPIRPPTSKLVQPTKSYLARPAAASKAPSPIKPQGGAATMLNSLVTKAKASRSASTRKITPASTTTASAAARARKQTAVPPPVPRATRARTSNTSESSANSHGTTIVRKPVPISKTAPAKKEPVKREPVKKAAPAKGSVRGTAATRKPSATQAAKAAVKSAATAAGRSLRSKRA